jgi:ubiquitin
MALLGKPTGAKEPSDLKATLSNTNSSVGYRIKLVWIMPATEAVHGYGNEGHGEPEHDYSAHKVNVVYEVDNTAGSLIDIDTTIANNGYGSSTISGSGGGTDGWADDDKAQFGDNAKSISWTKIPTPIFYLGYIEMYGDGDVNAMWVEEIQPTSEDTPCEYAYAANYAVEDTCYSSWQARAMCRNLNKLLNAATTQACWPIYIPTGLTKPT